jgi:putative NADH-flavin reductase
MPNRWFALVLILPGKGVVGGVGTLWVDAGTGELLTDPHTEREMKAHAQHLAQRRFVSE